MSFLIFRFHAYALFFVLYFYLLFFVSIICMLSLYLLFRFPFFFLCMLRHCTSSTAFILFYLKYGMQSQ